MNRNKIQRTYIQIYSVLYMLRIKSRTFNGSVMLLLLRLLLRL